MQPLGTKVYLLKRYSPSDSFFTFFSGKKEEKERKRKTQRGKIKPNKHRSISQNIFLYVPQSLFLSQNKNEKSNRDYLSNISDLFFTIGSLFLTFLTFVSCNSYFFKISIVDINFI